MEDVQNNLIDHKVAVINAKNLQHQNGNASNGLQPDLATKGTSSDFTPPDGGSRAWLVMVGSFLCNGILFGVINSYSVLYREFYGNLVAKNVSDASSKACKFWSTVYTG